MVVSALRDRWAGVPLWIRRGVVGHGEGLEVGECAEHGEVEEMGEQREVEAELWDGGERWEVPVAVSALRGCWEGVPHGLRRGVAERGDGLEVGERAEHREVGDGVERREV